MVIRAYKFRLYPNKEQRKGMQTHLWLSKNLWNGGLEFAKQLYKDYEKFPTRQTYQEISKNSGLHSQVAQDVFIRLHMALKAKIRRKKAGLKGGFPRFKSIDRVKSLHYPQSGFSLKERKLKVSPFGEINIKKHGEVEGTIKTLTLKRESSDKWYAILTAETEPINVPRKEGEQIGIDLGLMTFATVSNGEQIKKPKHMKIYEDRLADAQRDLSKKKLRSMNRRKAKLKVARVYAKVADTRKDWLHKTANSLISRYSVIVLEDLDVQGIAEEHGKGVNDAGWSIFTNIISYKAESAGCEVVFVNPKNTSKDCSRCGICVPKELWERQHGCPFCGLIMDRDLNAAINILNRCLKAKLSDRQETKFPGATVGTTESNACEDETIVSSMKQEAITSAQAKLW
ncbi:transposase [Candidatus Micrarchaeota archaeon]|nr:transposase [Candidatus Micrarchaeota archaeon]